MQHTKAETRVIVGALHEALARAAERLLAKLQKSEAPEEQACGGTTPDEIRQSVRRVAARRQPKGTACLCCKRTDRPTFEYRPTFDSAVRVLCRPCLTDPAVRYVDCKHGE